MSRIKPTFLAVCAAVTGLATLAATTAPSEAAVCRNRMDGEGRGQGVAGKGTELAKANAASDWSAKVQARHGVQFANFSKAQSVRYDCRSGAVLEAKCVVSAKPCRN